MQKPMPGKRGKPSRRVRLEDLATKCGVSVSTASRALAGGKGVNPDLRAKIIEAAKELNYAVPTSVAGRQVLLVASSVAMVNDIRNQFTFQVLDGINARSRVLGVEIVTRAIASPSELSEVLAEANDSPSIAGCLFLSLDDEELLSLSNAATKPIVLVNGEDPYMRLSSVAPCNRAAARMATQYLMQLGHRRILFLMRPGRQTIEHRLEGWRDAMKGHAGDWMSDYIVEVDDWLPELASQAIQTRINERGLDFTAILAASDSLAVGATAGLTARNVNVPSDVSIIGMDDLPQSAFFNPPLTTVHIPMRDIGTASLELLLEDLGGVKLPPRRVELACHIIERQSTDEVTAEL